MTEEEKEAIKILKQEPDFSLSYYKRERAIDIVLNLIEKQQKEIKELEQKSYKCEYLEEGEEKIIKNSISKDKIREFIKKETKQDTYNFDCISVKKLEELLEGK